MKSRCYELLFRVADAETRVSLPGAVFSLIKTGGITVAATSNEYGMIYFSALPTGHYTLTETSAPAGYVLNATAFPITVNRNGAVFINCQPQRGFVFLNEKADS